MTSGIYKEAEQRKTFSGCVTLLEEILVVMGYTSCLKIAKVFLEKVPLR